MNKLLSAASAVGMLLAVNAAQAGDVLTAEQMDTVTAGAPAASISAAIVSGNFSGTVTGTVQTVPTPLAEVAFTGSSPVGQTATTTVSAAASL